MLRRPIVSRGASIWAVCQRRQVSTEHKDIASTGAPLPPAITSDPITPLDFNPHIEWYEFPKEMFDPRYPFTREECVRATEEPFENTMDEMASRYGMRLGYSPKPAFWLAWFLFFFHTYWSIWCLYRSAGGEPHWPHFRHIVAAHPRCPTIEDADNYVDLWQMPFSRENHAGFDTFWQWKPLVDRNGCKSSYTIPFEHRDPSEWSHMITADY